MSNRFRVSPPKGPEDPAKCPDWELGLKSSARSLPLFQDDDYFYYHGEVDGRGGDNGKEPVDHVGALIGPSFSTPTKGPAREKDERELKHSLQSLQPSEITCDDWSVDSTECGPGGPAIEEGCKNEICVEEFVGLKMRVAELETQLQLRRWNGSLERKVQDLQDCRMSLECEARGLKQLLSVLQEEMTNMEDEISQIRIENEALRAENRRLSRRWQGCLQDSPSSRRGCSTSDVEGSHREGEEDDLDSSTEGGFLPFPRQPRRATTGSSMGVKCLPFPRRPRRATTGAEIGRATKGPSLLEALRSHIAATCGQPGRLESSDGSRATRATADATLHSPDISLYETWGRESGASTDATERYLQSSARLLKKIEDARKRDRLHRSKSKKCVSTAIGASSSPIPEPKRYKYFNLPRIGSSFRLVDSGVGEKEFDAKDELWDRSGRDGEEEDIARKHFRASAQF